MVGSAVLAMAPSSDAMPIANTTVTIAQKRRGIGKPSGLRPSGGSLMFI
jgi:hypothetical protein